MTCPYDHSFRLDYVPGERYIDPEAIAMDQEIAERDPCPRCGGRLVYRPWYDLSSHSYIAEALCLNCRHRFEF